MGDKEPTAKKMKLKNISKVVQIVSEEGKDIKVLPNDKVEVSERLGMALLDADPKSWKA